MIPFRDENPTRTFPFVVIALIAANTAVFLYQVFLPQPEQTLFTFTYADLVAAGAKGITKNVEPLGTISLRVDANNNFLASWTGGPAAATGVKDFAKSFKCDFAQ